MTNKENEWEKQNKLRDWKRHNQEEGKKIAILTQQVDKSTKWKTLRTIFNPTNIYQILEPLAEKPTILVVQVIIDKTLSSPTKKTK